MQSPFGFLIIDKPSGMTSHDCINSIRKIFNIKKVGHGGTLDPAVTGVLTIAVGNATRLLPYLPKEKAYKAIIQLGMNTTTDDLCGEIISQQKWPFLKKATLEKSLEKFRGTISQQPPNVSSVHFQGERAYKRARRGESFNLPKKIIKIFNLELIKWEQETGQLSINVHCSSGTYIRSLARDLGKDLKCGGCLAKLRRTEAQGFNEQKAITLKDLELLNFSTDPKLINVKLINPLEALNHLPKAYIKKEEAIKKWRQGQKITIDTEDSRSNILRNKNQTSIVICSEDEIEGIGEYLSPLIIKPKVVFNAYG